MKDFGIELNSSAMLIIKCNLILFFILMEIFYLLYHKCRKETEVKSSMVQIEGCVEAMS